MGWKVFCLSFRLSGKTSKKSWRFFFLNKLSLFFGIDVCRTHSLSKSTLGNKGAFGEERCGNAEGLWVQTLCIVVRKFFSKTVFENCLADLIKWYNLMELYVVVPVTTKINFHIKIRIYNVFALYSKEITGCCCSECEV